MSNDFDFTKALDTLLNDTSMMAQPSKKPKVAEVEKGILSEVFS